MFKKYFYVLFVVSTVFSCKKEEVSQKEQYIVSASKMIGLTGIDWNNAEPELKSKWGYKYVAAQPNATNLVKAEIRLPTIDDSSKIEQGNLYFNVTPDNVISFARYYTDPIPQAAAYGMMLNYHGVSLKILTGITHTTASYEENNTGANSTVAGILEKLRDGQTKDRLAISYKTLPRGSTFSMLLFKQNDGNFVFEFRGRW